MVTEVKEPSAIPETDRALVERIKEAVLTNSLAAFAVVRKADNVQVTLLVEVSTDGDAVVLVPLAEVLANEDALDDYYPGAELDADG